MDDFVGRCELPADIFVVKSAGGSGMARHLMGLGDGTMCAFLDVLMGHPVAGAVHAFLTLVDDGCSDMLLTVASASGALTLFSQGRATALTGRANCAGGANTGYH